MPAEPLVERARWLTSKLRMSEEARWRRLAEFLSVQGMDRDHVIVADVFADRVDEDWVVLVDADGRPWKVRLHYMDAPYGERSRRVDIEDWSELTEYRARFPHLKAIEAAVWVLDEEGTGLPWPTTSEGCPS